MKLRKATAKDLPDLTALSLRAKAHWGYDEAFMKACREELTLTPEKLADSEIWVAESDDGTTLGLIRLKESKPGVGEIWDLFVDPPHMGKGAGTLLMEKFVAWSEANHLARQVVEADPHALPFYQRFGFREIGSVPSGSIEGRSLPLMERRT